MTDPVHKKESRSSCRFLRSESVFHTYTWIIEDFEKRRDEKNGLKSSIRFKSQNGKDTLWFIALDYEPDPRDHTIIVMPIINASAKIRKVKTVVSVVDTSGSRSRQKIGEEKKQINEKPIDRAVFRFPLKHEDLIVVNDTLVIECEITLYSDYEEESTDEEEEKSLEKYQDSSKTKLMADLAQNRDQFTDIMIMVQGKIFPCHMFMLAARSRVFQAMFQSNMREKESGKIEIQDLTHEVVSEMLQFIYTGAVNKNLSEDFVRELFIAADKYQLDLLKNMCEEMLSSVVSIKSCLKNLSLAKLYMTKTLKKSSLEFIMKNTVAVTTSKEWLDCIKDQPELAAEVTQAIAKNCYNPEAKRRRLNSGSSEFVNL